MPHDWLLELRRRIDIQRALCPEDERAQTDYHLVRANHSPCQTVGAGLCFCSRPWPCAWVESAATRYGVEVYGDYSHLGPGAGALPRKAASAA
ncbi:hypothetical protein [Sinomonas humi]|uniref:Uncharacterized protein n=1 Tax=Sinomonas humi TaxID=1338436 RepID=A0A0B2ARE5_9MICC|nr:hypothetical protein [Sinomonas humi]KHL04507.1 hypothetical protein LK10_04735 [Sinomonas humi]